MYKSRCVNSPTKSMGGNRIVASRAVSSRDVDFVAKFSMEAKEFETRDTDFLGTFSEGTEMMQIRSHVTWRHVT